MCCHLLPSPKIVQSRPDSERLLEEDDDNQKRMRMAHQIVKSLTDETIRDIMLPERVFQMNKGLIHILQVINDSPSGNISTRDLLRTINSYNMHKLISKGERLGFIKRKTTAMPKGKKGGRMVVNSLTYEGKLLLKIASRGRPPSL